MNNFERVKDLKRQGDLEGAASLLEEMIEAEEASSLREFGVAPWPYEQLAIVRRKQKDLDAEMAVLERFAKQVHAPGVSPPRLVDRLIKVYILAGLVEERPCGDGQTKSFLSGGDTPVDHHELFLVNGAVVDVETTGLSNQDEVIELAIVPFRFSRRSGEVVSILQPYSGVREPGCEISPMARRVHGLSADDLRGQDLNVGEIGRLLDSAAAIFAHNASFDRRFVGALHGPSRSCAWYCTQRGIAWKELGCDSGKLEAVLAMNGVTFNNRHRASHDAQAVLSLLQCPHPETGKPYLLSLYAAGPLQPPRRSEHRTEPLEIRVSIDTNSKSGCALAALAWPGSLLWLALKYVTSA